MNKDERTTFSASAVKLDDSGNVPKVLPLFVTGHWKNSVKGDFKVTLDDLKEIKANFEAGIGFPTDDASTGLAIDFKHDYFDEAAAWIKSLQLQVDLKDPAQGILYANVEWTPGGEEAVQSGRFKCISPMGFFGTKGGKAQLWSNPTNLDEQRPNVLEGAGLTNIPFLRGMAPIRADKLEDLQNANANVIYVYDVRQKEQDSMNLDALRVKDREALSVPELDFIAEKRSELSAAEVTKFKLEPASTTGDQVSDEDRSTLDAIKGGTKKLVDANTTTVEKSTLDRLEKSALDYRTEKAASIVDGHVKRGAIKQDQTDFWTKQLLDAADDATRTSMETALKGLPDNDLLAKEIGTGEDVQAGSTAREQLHTIAKKRVDDAAKEGKTLLYADVLKEVYRESKDLRTQDAQDYKQKAGV